MTCFLPVPVDGRVAKCHGETVRRYQVQIDGSEVTCHDKIVSVPSKKQGTRASAHQPNHAVPGDETVWVPQDLINGKEFKGIELGIDYKSVLALATVPAVAASVQMLKFGGCYRRRRLKALN